MTIWTPKVRDYEKEVKLFAVTMQEVTQHPLLPDNRTTSTAYSLPRPPNVTNNDEMDPLVDILQESQSDGPLLDPLGAMTVQTSGFVDPLQSGFETTDNQNSLGETVDETNELKAAAAKQRNDAEIKQQAIDMYKDELNIPWALKKKQIVSDYSVTGSILMNKDAYDPFEGTGIEDGTQTRHLDKYANRLAALERRTINDNKVEITQGQFEAHVKKLSNDLDRAWERDERVNSLKISIQLAKLLSDTNYPQFYPVMFVLVTDVLEKFGMMVFNRLKGKAEESLNAGNTSKKQIKLADDFKTEDVPLIAKETCRNWFYKAACIKELLPRLLIETTLLRSYRFLMDDDYSQILTRMGSLSRGLGDPLVSLYAKAYLVVKGKEVAPKLTQYANNMLLDSLFSYKDLRDTHHQIELVRCGIDEARYVHLMVPGIDWITKCVGLGAQKDDFQTILHQYREHCNDAMVLRHLIASFDGSLYLEGGAGALAMVQLIRSAVVSSTTATDVFVELGKQLVIYPPPEELLMPVLNEVWRIVTKTQPEEIESYVKCAAVWLDVVQRYYGEKELFVILADLTRHVDEAQLLGIPADSKDSAPRFSDVNNKSLGAEDAPSLLMQESEVLSDGVLRLLETILTSLVSRKSDYTSSILTSEYTLRLLDVFKGRRKISLCMDILDSFNRTHGNTGDAVLIHTMFDIGRSLHDSLDHMSAEGDKKQVSFLLNGLIDKIDFGKDLEQQLNTYVECRGVFTNLDLVQDKLTSCAGQLAVKTYAIMKGKHTKKTAAFAKACLAYCHITIASIKDTGRKLFLLLRSAQISLLNSCLPQTDTFLKAAISLIPEMAPWVTESADRRKLHSEAQLASFIRNLLSTLVLVPGHPDHGPFYIVCGLLNAMPKYQWQEGSSIKCSLYIDILALLATYAQSRFPYSMPHLESNDVLYCGAPGYMFELKQQIQVVMDEIMIQLSAFVKMQGGESSEVAVGMRLKQARLVLELANQLSTKMVITTEAAEFLKKLLDLAYKSRSLFTKADVAFWDATLLHMRACCAQAKLSSEHPLLARLLTGYPSA